ncbi:MAG: hypothetical protein NVSMB34_11670 [Variovorax sp.]
MPPAAKGTTMRTGLVGQAFWAQEVVAIKAMAVAAQAPSAARRFNSKDEVMRAFVQANPGTRRR